MSDENDKLAAAGEMAREFDATLASATPEARREAEEQQAQVARRDEAAKGWGFCLYLAGQALGKVDPRLSAPYTEAACLEWGASVVPVAEKYGLNGPGNVPELALAAGTILMVAQTWATWQDIKAERAQLAAQSQRQAVAAAQGVADGGQ